MKPKKSSSLSSISFQPKNIRFRDQSPDEDILLFVRQHKIVLLPKIFWAAFLSVIPPVISISAGFVQNYGFDLTFGIPHGIWYAFSVLIYFWIFAYIFQSFLNWYFNVYVMTNERLMDFSFEGILSHSADETNLMKIATAESAIGGFWGTIFNMGVITVRTAADVNNFRLENIPQPDKVRDFIMEYIINKDSNSNNLSAE